MGKFVGVAIIGKYGYLEHRNSLKTQIIAPIIETEKYFSAAHQVNLIKLFDAVMYSFHKYFYKDFKIEQIDETFSKLSKKTKAEDAFIELCFYWALSILKRKSIPKNLLTSSKNKSSKYSAPKGLISYTNNKNYYLSLIRANAENLNVGGDFFNTESDRILFAKRLKNYDQMLKEKEFTFFKFPNKILNFTDHHDIAIAILNNIATAKIAEIDPSIEYRKSFDRFRKKKIKHKKGRKREGVYQYKKSEKRGRIDLRKKGLN